MAYYIDNPFAAPSAIEVEQAWATFLFGSRKITSAPTTMQITGVAITTNVATVNVTMYEGDVPVVGGLISIRGTQTNGGIFNVSNVAITAVSASLATTSVGTVSFALVNANVTTVADTGTAKVPVAIKGEAIAAGASIAGAVAFPMFSRSTNGIYAEAFFPTLPTAVTVTLQQAMVNQDAYFTDVPSGTVATVAAGVITANGGNFQTNAPFLRFKISGLTGSGTIAAALTA